MFTRSIATALVALGSLTSVMFFHANPNFETNCQPPVIWYSSSDFGVNQAKADAWREGPNYAKTAFCSRYAN